MKHINPLHDASEPPAVLGHTRPDIRELVDEAIQHDAEFVAALTCSMQRFREQGRRPRQSHERVPMCWD